MNILALDTAAADCAVCIADGDGRIVGRAVETIGKGHAERLIPLVDQAFLDAGMTPSDIGRIAVNVGPGSFTGIRVGVATARALALATGAKSVGVSTLAALAFQHRARHPGLPLVAAIDARRNEVYAQVFDPAGLPLSQAAALSVDALAGFVQRFDAVAVGSGAVVAGLSGASAEDHIEIETIARIGSAIATDGPVSPIYLRAPDARPQAGYALSRV